MSVVRVKQGVAATLAALVVAGGVAGLTMRGAPTVDAVPVVEARAEVQLPQGNPSGIPSTTVPGDGGSSLPGSGDHAWGYARPVPKPVTQGPLLGQHQYAEDWYLPRPIDKDAVFPDDVNFVETQGNGTLATPVAGRRTSPFGMRMHPILKVYKMHTGLDFAAPCGTPIGSAADGTITGAGWSRGYGYMVTVKHGEIRGYDVVTRYAHMSSSAVRVGDKVKRHQAIGRVGNTGYSTGCHLHFEVLAGGQFTDPDSWLKEGAAIVFTDGMVDIPAGADPGPSPSPTASESPSSSPTPPDESPSPTPPETSQPGQTPTGEPTAPSKDPSTQPPSTQPPSTKAPSQPPSTKRPDDGSTGPKDPSDSPSEPPSNTPTPGEPGDGTVPPPTGGTPGEGPTTPSQPGPEPAPPPADEPTP